MAYTNITIRNILKKGPNVYNKFAGKAVAFCFDVWQNEYINKTGERGSIIKVNDVLVTSIVSNNNFTNGVQFETTSDPSSDRVKLETVNRYSNLNEWSIIEPQYNPSNPAPYLGAYTYSKLISEYPGTNPLTGEDLEVDEQYIADCLKIVVFGFIDSNGLVKDISGTCGNNIVLTCENGYIPKKITGCRLDFAPSRSDCSYGSKQFDFTIWNNRQGFSGIELGDIPVSK